MGISAGGSKSGSARSEINVTPLVDIVLVLLIIFLVTMPIMMKQVMLKVPRKLQDNEELSKTPEKSYSILVCAKTARCNPPGTTPGDVVISDGEKDQAPIALTQLGTQLKPIIDGMKNEKLIFVDYCDHVQWGVVVESMDQILSIAKMHDEVETASKNLPDIKIALKMRDKKGEGGGFSVDHDGCPCDQDPNGLHPCASAP
jgi:biopolymer transport protein ExbD